MEYEPEYIHPPRPRRPGRRHLRPVLLITGIGVLSVTGLLLATCGDTIIEKPAAAASERVMEKVSRQIQKVLGRTVTIHSDGIVAFPREVVEVVLENHDIQATTRYQSTGWFGWGESQVVMSGRYRARVGFDLGKASAEIQDGTLRLWLPKPRVLAFETLKVDRQTEDVSWWNPLEPAEMEAAYRANRAEAACRLDEPELLKGATDRLLRRMREGLDGLGLDVRVEMLPPPPV
jgi:hypothetical protein